MLANIIEGLVWVALHHRPALGRCLVPRRAPLEVFPLNDQFVRVCLLIQLAVVPREMAARLEERRVELVNWFLGGMQDALHGLLDLEDRLCFQQVHDGQVEACMAAVAGLGLDSNDF